MPGSIGLEKFINRDRDMIRKLLQIKCLILYTTLFLASTTAICLAANDKQKITALTPVTPAAPSGKASAKSIQQEHEAYIRRNGEVSFAADTFLPKSPKTGKRSAAAASFRGRSLSVSFFPEQTFDIDISRESRPQKGVLSMNGKGRSKKLSTFSMTVTEENYLISYQDLDTATLYRVVGSTQTGRGTVTEIDLEKLPPSSDLPPRVPSGQADSE
jgi:hypothetical protein